MSAIAKLPPALQGKVMAALAAVPTLTKEIAAIRAKQSKSEIEQLVAANTTKIPKALEQWALGTTVEVLTAFLKNAPETSAPKTPKEQTTTETVALTDADRVSAKLAGFTPEQVLAHKKKMHDERLEQERIRRG
jgi:phage I-like protein